MQFFTSSILCMQLLFFLLVCTAHAVNMGCKQKSDNCTLFQMKAAGIHRTLGASTIFQVHTKLRTAQFGKVSGTIKQPRGKLLSVASSKHTGILHQLKVLAMLMLTFNPVVTFGRASSRARSALGKPTLIGCHRGPCSDTSMCSKHTNPFRATFLCTRHKMTRFQKYPLKVSRMLDNGGIEGYLEAAEAVMAEKEAGQLTRAQGKTLTWQALIIPLLELLLDSKYDMLTGRVVAYLRTAASDMDIPLRVDRSRLPQLRAVLEAALVLETPSLPVQLQVHGQRRTVMLSLGREASSTNLTALLAPANASDVDCMSMAEIMGPFLNETAQGVLARRAALAESIVNRELVLKSSGRDGRVAYPHGHAKDRRAGLPACALVLRAYLAAGDACGSRRWAAHLADSVAPHPWRNYCSTSLLQEYDALAGSSGQDLRPSLRTVQDDMMIGIASRIATEFRHGAVVVDENGTILANGTDVEIAESAWRKQARGGHKIHAEMDALRKLALSDPANPGQGLERARGSTLYVSVFAHGGYATYASPCPLCTQAIKALGVRRVCSTTHYGHEEWYPEPAQMTNDDLLWLDLQDLIKLPVT